MFRKDNLPLGIILGVFTPVIAFFLYYVFFVMMPRHISLGEFFTMISDNKQMQPKLISICLLLNGLVFYFYTRIRRDVTAKGIFLVTMLYAILIILLKILHG
ncbi:hypothetical protein SIO70_32145 [Chitinophaga sancti]|uniref:hypothetical protein n=1 Tax=Chitinophaga sancti TaxID=1004 RepID=UPI002A74F50F|nr:hypothetical protein [Chitinophaga sancti]WPQ63019.1 hypothetical protein SIO70_32145 [Chitinophaga sancti]